MEVAPGVLVVETSVADGKAGVIAGDRVALAVDAGIDEAEGAAILAAARSLGREDVQLIYTHGHADHALGGSAFRGHTILGRPGIVAHIDRQSGDWAERLGTDVGMLEGVLGWPTSIVPAGHEVDLGRRRVIVLDTPGHAPDALCVWDPDHGVLFGGDTVVTGILPAFADGDAATLEATQRRLAELSPDVLVPGHGEVVRGAAAIRAAITWSADYIRRCREHVEARPDIDVETLVSLAAYESFVGDHFPRARHRMVARHERTVRVLAEQVRSAATGTTA